MKLTLWFLSMLMAARAAGAQQGATPAVATQNGAEAWREAQRSAVIIQVADGSGNFKNACMGMIIRSDGMVLTTYHALKGAQHVQVRLSDGDVYDHIVLVGLDERRDAAALEIGVGGLAALSAGALGEVAMGERVYVLAADSARGWSISDGILGPVRLAEEVLGAPGVGYHVIPFLASLPPGSLGGALVNSRGQLLGIFSGSPYPGGQQLAIPAESLVGLPAQGLHMALGAATIPAMSGTASGQAAQREAVTPVVAMANAQTLRVTSQTTYFKPFMLEKELLDNAAFRNLGIRVLDGFQGGDLLVNVDRPVFTYDFTYCLKDSHTGTVLATGKVTAIDGPHAAQGIAKRILQELEKARPVQTLRINPVEAVAMWQ